MREIRMSDSKNIIIILISCVLFIMAISPIISASFVYKNNSLETKYVGGEAIRGNIELRFIDEPAGSLLTSNFEGAVELIDLLKSSGFEENKDYNCSIRNCAVGYKTKSSVQTLPLNMGDNTSIGFRITGKNVEIDSARLNIETNGAASCTRPYIISVLGNNETSLQTNKYKDVSCGTKARGCFDSSLGNYDSATITSDAYCEKIKIPIGPAYRVGGKIKNSTIGYGKLKIEMFDESWESLGKCDLPRHNMSNIEELNCIIEYAPVTSKDVFVCVGLESGTSANYEINSEQTGNICGTTGVGSEQLNRDYDLFAESLQFDSIGMEINESLYSVLYSESLALSIDSFIADKYERNCAQGCIIPFMISSGSTQNMNFNNVEIKYRDTGALLKNNQIYLLERELSNINSGYLKLNIEKANFFIPALSRENSLQVFLAGRTILPRTLTINITPGFAFDIQPKFILPGIDTLFNAITSQNITKSEWDFGDGNNEETQGKSLKHRYLAEGSYDIKVSLTRKDNVKVSKNFTVIVGNSSGAIKIISKNYEERIANLSKQIESYDSWIALELRKKINVSEINESINKAKEEAESLESNKSEIVEKLAQMEVPKSIVINKRGSLPIDVGYDSLDSSYIVTLSKKDLNGEDKDKLKEQIIGWLENNYNVDIEFKTISSFQEDVKPLFTTFKVKITNKKQQDNEAYLILGRPKDEIVFKENYGQIEVEGESGSATAIPVKDSEEIDFLLPEEVEIEEVGAYIAPDISKLSVEEDIGKIEPNPRPKIAFYWYIFLILGFFIIYIVLQEWYKRRYENYLFKNKDDLYNVINFIFNQRIIKMSDNEIRRRLLGTGWKGEQLNYAFKKIDGKRTGMLEIPIFKFLENRKVREEIAKRQQKKEILPI
ncbi:PKD domain-containing protein [Candidatus Pacearchaeota archaeon]|nr:PKD domain-containing protein [Candidatus Pacearchaeota archaeon]